MSVDRDGYKFIAVLLIAGCIFLFVFRPLTIFFFLLAPAVALFFRESKKVVAFADDQIISPASGKVIDIREVFEPDFLKTQTRRVSIFMSLFDEHINYAPITGEVVYLFHRSGGYKRAYLEEASAENETREIGIQAGDFSCLVKQIAGVVARRIVCRSRDGDRLTAGQKLGLIRFGSRVELFLPLTAEIDLRAGQKVRGGRTVIGRKQ